MHYDSDSDSGESEVTAQEIDQPIPTPKVITVIGKTGSGKSETVNLLTGYNDKKDKNYCYVSNDPDSCTTTCKVVTAKISCRQSFEVVDTPGLFDTENRSEEMFIGVTEQLKKSGGFVYILTKDVRVEKQLLDIMRALHLVLGDYFSCSVVLVRTSPPRYESRDEMLQNLETFKLHVESKLSTLGIKFFGVIWIVVGQQRNDCGVPAGVTKTWKEILDATSIDPNDPEAVEKVKNEELERLKKRISDTKNRLGWVAAGSVVSLGALGVSFFIPVIGPLARAVGARGAGSMITGSGTVFLALRSHYTSLKKSLKDLEANNHEAMDRLFNDIREQRSKINRLIGKTSSD